MLLANQYWPMDGAATNHLPALQQSEQKTPFLHQGVRDRFALYSTVQYSTVTKLKPYQHAFVCIFRIYARVHFLLQNNKSLLYPRLFLPNGKCMLCFSLWAAISAGHIEASEKRRDSGCSPFVSFGLLSFWWQGAPLLNADTEVIKGTNTPRRACQDSHNAPLQATCPCILRRKCWSARLYLNAYSATYCGWCENISNGPSVHIYHCVCFSNAV